MPFNWIKRKMSMKRVSAVSTTSTHSEAVSISSLPIQLIRSDMLAVADMTKKAVEEQEMKADDEKLKKGSKGLGAFSRAFRKFGKSDYKTDDGFPSPNDSPRRSKEFSADEDWDIKQIKDEANVGKQTFDIEEGSRGRSSSIVLTPCIQETCIKECFTCGPPAILRPALRMSKTGSLSSTERAAFARKKNVRWNEKKQKEIAEDEESLRSSGDSTIFYENDNAGTNLLVAHPIDAPMIKMNLGEALLLLLKQGVGADESDNVMNADTVVLKSPRISQRESSEPSNVELVEAGLMKKTSSEIMHARMLQDSYTGYQWPTRSKSEPLAVARFDTAVQTSLENVGPALPKDSLIQLKTRDQLEEGSCTQYFALKSPLQIEAYLQARRVQEAESKIKMADKDAIVANDLKVFHQKGELHLSVASINLKDIYPESDSKESQILPSVLEDEKVLASVDLMPSELTTLKQNLRSFGTSTFDANITFSCCHTCKLQAMMKTLSDLKKIPEDEEEEEGVEEDPCDYEYEDVPSECSVTIYQPMDSMSMFSDMNLPDYLKESSSDSLNSAVLADKTQQQFILVLQNLRPSKQMRDFSTASFDYESIPTFMLKWNFLKTSDSFTFNLEGDANVLPINYIKSYDFDITEGVYLYLLKCAVPIELYYVNFVTETLIAKCNLKLGRCFLDVSKIYESSLEIHNKDLCYCFPRRKRLNFGQLVCRYRLRGAQEKFDRCRPVKVPFQRIAPLIEPVESELSPADIKVTSGFYKQISHHSRLNNGIQGNAVVSEAELQAFQDGLNLVLVRNKALRTTQEEITNELKDRTTWMHEELKWRLTLQENAILCGRDPGAVKWRQWKDDTTANVRYRPISHEEFFKDGKVHIEIEILELYLNQECKVMTDENVTHLYIEFAFLDYFGPEMETATMRKPIQERPIRFKFKRVFELNIADTQATMLASLIKDNESINFTIIAQPIEDIKELQSCFDFGVANLVLFDLLQSRHNTTVETIPVKDSYKKEKIIGSLKVKFIGVLAMRSMALHLLTPESFKIIR